MKVQQIAFRCRAHRYGTPVLIEDHRPLNWNRANICRKGTAGETVSPAQFCNENGVASRRHALENQKPSPQRRKERRGPQSRRGLSCFACTCTLSPSQESRSRVAPKEELSPLVIFFAALCVLCASAGSRPQGQPTYARGYDNGKIMNSSYSQ
jgi:hypothetical protein